MGFKRSAKAGDFKKALEVLEIKRGFVEGTPKSILISLGFDGSWNEFRAQINANVVKTDLGRFAVSQTDPKQTRLETETAHNYTDVSIFAICASSYILGQGIATDLEDFTGEYETLDELTTCLAAEIDNSIGGLYLPYKSVDDIEIYSLERGIFYNAVGDGMFTVYGSTVLANA